MKVALALTIAIALIFKTALAQTEFSPMALETDKQIKKAGAAAPATLAPTRERDARPIPSSFVAARRCSTTWMLGNIGG